MTDVLAKLFRTYVQELTYIIKQDIANLNQSIAGLQGFTNSNFPGAGGAAGKAGDKQVAEHNKNVLVMLQSKLADTSIGFKDILEIRTQNMKASRDRTEQFSYAGSSQASSAHDSPLFRAANSHAGKGKGREDAGPNGAMSGGVGSRPGSTGPGGGTSYKQHGGAGGNSDFLALDMGAAEKGIGGGQSNGGGDFMQMQLVEQQDSYIQQRGTAIESIEGTIAELGQIFSQLATMVAQQGEQVTRIDADVEEISTNVSGAQRELLKYFASVSSNRALMLKIMGVLVAFFLLFVLVYVSFALADSSIELTNACLRS